MAASRAIAQSIFAAGDVGAGGGFPLDVGCPVSRLVQDATDRQSVFRPQFAGMFHQPVIGIVTKIETLTAVSDRAEHSLRQARAETIIRTSSFQRLGLTQLRQHSGADSKVAE
jgi:ethanolamine utilization protein EutP (predicted NTPase)